MGRSVMDGVGEGTWAVFAEKVSAERDEAREKLMVVSLARCPALDQHPGEAIFGLLPLLEQP